MKQWDLNKSMWFIILSGYAALFFMLIHSGRLMLYLHPKMHPFTYITFIVLVILAVVTAFTPGNSGKFKRGYFIFFFPLLLAVTVNPTRISPDIAAANSVYVTEGSFEESVGLPSYATDDVAAPEVDVTTAVNHVYDGVDFKKTMIQLFDRPGSLTGQTIQLSGFVYKADSFDSETFLISRFLMSCCAADLQLVGVMGHWTQADQLTANAWYQFTGTVKVMADGVTPMIEIEGAVSVDEPSNPYIYP